MNAISENITIREYLDYLGRYIEEELGGVDLGKLTEEELAEIEYSRNKLKAAYVLLDDQLDEPLLVTGYRSTASPVLEKQPLWQKITSSFKEFGRKPTRSLGIGWTTVLEAYIQRQPESFIDAGAALIEYFFPKEKSTARSGLKAFLVGRGWEPYLGGGGWSTASGTAFNSGEVTGSQQTTALLLLALEMLQSRFSAQPSIGEADIRAALRDPDFQKDLVERGIQAGIQPKVARRLVKELPDIS